MSNKVYLSKVKYDIHEKILEGLNWIDWREIIKSDSTVLVKPNFVWPEHLPGVTTTPEFLNKLLNILRDRCGHVIVGESNGQKFNVEKAFKNHKMYEICKNNGVELCNFSKMPSRFVEKEVGRKKVKIELPNIILDDIDVFITVPVLKTHVFTTVSISLKNQWGCIPDSMRLFYHPILNHGIVAINNIIKPRISIVDGIHALNGNGPILGDPVKLNTIIVTNDIVAADSIGALIMGFSPQKIKHIKMAEKEGMGFINIEKIDLKGNLPKSAQFKVKLKLMDILGYISSSNNYIVKITYDSPLTPIIYKIIRREPPRKII